MADDPVAAVEFETMVLGRHLLSSWRQREGEHLDRSAYLVLSRVSVQGPMSIAQLSEAFGLDVSTVNRQTAAMLRADLLERIPDPDGGLARKFQLTPRGERLLAQEREWNVGGLGRVLEGWSADDIATLSGLLKRFNVDIERRDGRPWPRSAPVAREE